MVVASEDLKSNHPQYLKKKGHLVNNGRLRGFELQPSTVSQKKRNLEGHLKCFSAHPRPQKYKTRPTEFACWSHAALHGPGNQKRPVGAPPRCACPCPGKGSPGEKEAAVCLVLLVAGWFAAWCFLWCVCLVQGKQQAKGVFVGDCVLPLVLCLCVFKRESNRTTAILEGSNQQQKETSTRTHLLVRE